MSEEEEWKRIDGSPSHSVSTRGRVRNDMRGGSVVGNIRAREGYQEVSLLLRGHPTTIKVHRLVADAFVSNPCRHIYDSIDHIDGDRTNNEVTNLRWTTRALNALNRDKHREGVKGCVNFMPGQPYRPWRALCLEPHAKRRKSASFVTEEEARLHAERKFDEYKEWLEEDTLERALNCHKCYPDPATSHPASWSS